MEISINLQIIPDLIDCQEWENVYEESLALLGAYPFLDKIVDREKYGCHWVYMNISKERKLENANDRLGWYVFGDAVSMKTAENFTLVKDLKFYRRRQQEANCHDILFSLINWNRRISEPIQQLSVNERSVFESKTQGYPYHLNVLAIACLIESRFPHYAVVFGDISICQMNRAIEWANAILLKPIQLTDRADNEKLLERMKKVLQEESCILEAFMKLTLNTSDDAFGKFVREHFSPGVLKQHFVNQFKQYSVNMVGFKDLLADYLDQGYSLEEACDNCVLDENGCSFEPIAFMETILALCLDKETDQVDSILQFATKNSENMKSTFTWEKITTVFQEKFGGLCDVDLVLQMYISKNKNADSKLRHKVNDDLNIPQYDIDNSVDLLHWETQNTIHPQLENFLMKIRSFIEALLEKNEEELDRFHSSTAREKMQKLITKNRYVYIHKKTWDYIELNTSNDHLIDRIFGILSINAEEQTTHNFCNALLNNLSLLRKYIL